MLAAALVVAGCGDDGGSGSGLAGPAVGGALASVVRIDAAVDARLDAASEFTEVGDPVGVDEGDEVRTDGSGFAEVTYFDGSITRLDVDTSFTVTELADAPDASVVRTDMGLGRTYHRVAELTGEDLYEVSTSVATATVRGTAFVVTCAEDGPCTFDVLDGTVEITPTGERDALRVETGESVTVDAGGAGPTGPLEPGLTSDRWITRNLDLDTEAGHRDLESALGEDDGNGTDGADGGPGGPGNATGDACAALTDEQVQDFLDDLEGGAADGPWDFVLVGTDPDFGPEDCEWFFDALDERALNPGEGAFGSFFVSIRQSGECEDSMAAQAGDESVSVGMGDRCATASIFFFYPFDNWDAVSVEIADALTIALDGAG